MINLMIRRKIISVGFASALLVIMTSAIRKSSGPPGCYSGEPPNMTNCTSCHGGQVNVGNADITFNLGGAENGYTPGQEYTITVAVKKNGVQAAGFQIIALQENNNTISPGNIILDEPARTQRIDPNNPHAHNCGILNRVWVTHRYQGIFSDPEGENRWTYKWIAPEEYVGNVVFYLAALEANYDLTEEGDYTYTRTLISPDLVSTVHELTTFSHQLWVYPNPAESVLNIQSENNLIHKISIFSLNGALIKELFVNYYNEATELSIDLSDICAGMYLLKAENLKGAFAFKRFIVAK
jgi:hypothetical protein